jgi:hypothetical protein
VGTNSVGCDSVEFLNLVITTSDISVGVKMILEGFATNNDSLLSSLYNLQYTSNRNLVDTIEVNLWSPNSLHNANPDFTYKTLIKTNGTAEAFFPCTTLGSEYYIAVKHRNCIETWSQKTIIIQLSNNYNFTDSLNSAYNNGTNPPMKSINNNKFAFYSGDANQDGTIDVFDLQVTENDAYHFEYGYVNSDCNGDGAADALDMQLIENNCLLFLFTGRPY